MKNLFKLSVLLFALATLSTSCENKELKDAQIDNMDRQLLSKGKMYVRVAIPIEGTGRTHETSAFVDTTIRVGDVINVCDTCKVAGVVTRIVTGNRGRAL